MSGPRQIVLAKFLAVAQSKGLSVKTCRVWNDEIRYLQGKPNTPFVILPERLAPHDLLAEETAMQKRRAIRCRFRPTGLYIRARLRGLRRSRDVTA